MAHKFSNCIKHGVLDNIWQIMEKGVSYKDKVKHITGHRFGMFSLITTIEITKKISDIVQEDIILL